MKAMSMFDTPAPADRAVEGLRAVLGKLTDSDRGFAQKLLADADRRGLSPKQREWVLELTRRVVKPAKVVDVPAFAGVVALLAKASETLKFPKLLVRVDGQDYRLSIAGPTSKVPGSVNVTDAGRGFAERKWFGRVTREGRFEPSRGLTQETSTAIGQALEALAKDPAKVATEYGKLTGSCCFCGLGLTDGRSVAVGYGPICAERWGLPWGAK